MPHKTGPLRGAAASRRKTYTDANQKAWEEAAPIHAKQTFERLLRDFKQPGYSCLDSTVEKTLRSIDVTGMDVAHLCCNNGRELLSIKNLGANRCVGFDCAPSFIRQAQQIADECEIEAEFVACDVYDISITYAEEFDMIYVSVGTIGWMPDLDGFFRVLRTLLRPGGWVVIYEMHPILDMFDEAADSASSLRYSYFRQQPIVSNDGLDYLSKQAYTSAEMYWFPHKMSDIITTVLKYEFSLRSFREYEHDVSAIFDHFENLEARPPLSYSLVARI